MGTKLIGAMLVVLGLVTGIAYVEVSKSEREQLLSSRERAATMVTELFAAGVTAPLAFADEAGVREHLTLLAANASVVSAAVWGADAEHTGRRGEKLGEVVRTTTPPAPPLSALPTAVLVVRTHDAVVVEHPVLGASGEALGAVQLAFSLTTENAAIVAAERRTLFTSLATGLGLAATLVLLTRMLIVTRLARLAGAAKHLEDGAAVAIDVDGNDEVGGLSRALRSMSAAISAREADISAKNRDLRRVLDNVEEGLITVTMDGRMLDERSRILETWFGRASAESSFFDYVAGFAPIVARTLRLGWSTLADDIMPIEVVLDQLPRRFEHGARHFALDYRPIWGDTGGTQVLEQVLVVVREVTSVVARERAERAQREAMNVFRRILDDRASFREFFEGTTRLVEGLREAQEEPSRLLRDIHTVKGNAAIYGLDSVAEVCHRVESRVQEESGTPSDDDLEQISTAWRGVRALVSELDAAVGEERIEVSVHEYEAHLQALAESRADREILASARSWTNELASRRLDLVAEQARALARRLGKGTTRVVARVAPPTLRLPPASWAPVWSVFAHVLRNAMDHGVEASGEREAAGKASTATLEIALTASASEVELRVSDDGRGIAWDAIRRRAEELGLPHGTRSELEEALFADEVSSLATASETSGRGVGMGAVRDAVRAAGGTIVLETTAGQGTTWRFRFPRTILDARAPSHSGRNSARPTESVRMLASRADLRTPP